MISLQRFKLLLADVAFKESNMKILSLLILGLLPLQAFASDNISSLSQKILGDSHDDIMLGLQETWKILHYPLFKINDTNFSIITFVVGLLILLIGIKLAKTYTKVIKRLSDHPKLTLTPSTVAMLGTLGYYFIVFVTLMIVLSFSGINLTSFTIIMSALSVGIGFGLQTIFSNFISGLLLMFENTIRIGDIIEIDNNLAGKVTDIRMRSTTILTFDNIEVLVPNKTFVENNVINWTLTDNIKRLKIPFGVAYGTSADLVDQVIHDEVMVLTKDFIKDDPDREPVVRMTGMGDNSVNFELWVWIRVGVKDKSLAARYDDFNRAIYRALNEHNISIPFPQRDLHWVSISSEVAEALKTKSITPSEKEKSI